MDQQREWLIGRADFLNGPDHGYAPGDLIGEIETWLNRYTDFKEINDDSVIIDQLAESFRGKIRTLTDNEEQYLLRRGEWLFNCDLDEDYIEDEFVAWMNRYEAFASDCSPSQKLVKLMELVKLERKIEADMDDMASISDEEDGGYWGDAYY